MWGVPTVTMIFGPIGTLVVTLVGNSTVLIVSGGGSGVFVGSDAVNGSGGIMLGEQAHRIKVQRRSVFESLVIQCLRINSILLSSKFPIFVCVSRMYITVRYKIHAI